MTEQKVQASLSRTGERPDGDLVESWKEIAVFFKRDVRTVQLWERHERMPVHRHAHRKVATVHAYRSELRTWWNLRCKEQNAAGMAPAETTALNAPSHNPISWSIACVLEWVHSGGVTHGMKPPVNLRREIERRIQLLTRWRLVTSPDGDTLVAGNGETDWRLRGIRYLLSGTILESGHRYQINLQLTCLKSHSTLWSGQFTGIVYTAADQQSLAERIALTVARHILVFPNSISAIEEAPPAGRQAYLRGRHFWNMRSQPEAIRRAMEEFKLATELDPGHAPSFAGLADCYTLMSWLPMLPRRAAVSNARRAATQAILLDATLSEAHVSLAAIFFDFEWNWEGAEREFLHAIRLNPSNAQAYQWYGDCLSILGADQEAIHAAQRAQELDPASAIVASFLGYALYRSGQTHDAKKQYQYALNIDADCMMAYVGLGLASIQEERFDEAIHCFAIAGSLSGDRPDVLAMMAHGYALKGDKARARTLLAQLRTGVQRHNTPVLDIAATYVALHDADAAFDCLHAGMKYRKIGIPRLRRDPRLLPLHSDRRFSRLVDMLRMP
jgi:tetratricopeptide (TPR) repeat protein